MLTSQIKTDALDPSFRLPPRVDGSKVSHPLEALLQATKTLQENLENNDTFAQNAKNFADLVAKVKNKDVQTKARELLNNIDEHAASIKTPTRILAGERKVQGIEAQIKDFQEKMGPVLENIQRRANETQNALFQLYLIDNVPDNPTTLQYFRSLLFEYRTRIPIDTRKEAWSAAYDVRMKIDTIQERVKKLKDPADAKAIILDLNKACIDFLELKKKHKRSIDRVAFGEMLYAPLVAAANFIDKLSLDAFDADDYVPGDTTHVKDTPYESLKDAAKLNREFVQWRTTEAPYQEEERKYQNERRQINLAQIQLASRKDELSQPAPYSEILSEYAGRLNKKLEEERSKIHKHPIDARLAPFELIEHVQHHLDALIDARADGDFKRCNLHANKLMETLRDAKAHAKTDASKQVVKAIESDLNEMLYAIDTSTEKSEYPTKIKLEQDLREGIQSTIQNTRVIIERLKEMGYTDSYMLIEEANTFIQACKQWQKGRVGALPDERQASNDFLVNCR